MEDDNERVNELEIEGSEIKSMAALMDVGKCVCKIQYRNNKAELVSGTGFFIKLEANNSDILYSLMTNEHVISQNILNLNTLIEIKYDNQHKNFVLILDKIENNKKRFIRNYRYLNIDAVVIEIFPNEVGKEYFLLPNIDYNEGYQEFINELISIVQFPGGKDLNYSVGKIINVVGYCNEIIHKSATKKGSSGSPICIKE